LAFPKRIETLEAAAARLIAGRQANLEA